MNNEIFFAELDLEVVVERAVIIVGDFVDKRAINPLVGLFLLLETMSNFLREVETEVADGLTLENLLWLVELFPHESVKVIVEHKVLELSQLLGEQLLLDLVQDVVGLVVLEVSSHVHLLLELHRDNQDVLVVVVFVGEELLMSKLK